MDDTDIVSPTGNAADCARFDAQCGGYMERDLESAEQAWMTAHRSACATCAAMVRELEAIVTESKTLPGISPTRDLWSGIEARLDTSVIPISAATTRTRFARTVSMRTFAIAATMLVAVTSVVTWRLAARGSAVPASSTSTAIAAGPTLADSLNDRSLSGESVNIVAASPSTTASRIASSAASPTTRPLSGSTTRLASRSEARDDRDGTDADVVYEREISALRRIVDDRVVELDTATVRELRRNLDIIDQAINDSRKALARDPRSALLSTQLDRALETKLALLRRVALL